MNSLFENGGRKVFKLAYTHLCVGNNIGKIDKKPVPSIYTSVYIIKYPGPLHIKVLINANVKIVIAWVGPF